MGNVEILLGVQRKNVENVKTLSGETLTVNIVFKTEANFIFSLQKISCTPKISRDDHSVPIALNLQIIAINTLQIASRNH